MSTWLRMFYSKCPAPYSDCSANWARGYANALKDTGNITSLEHDQIRKYIDLHHKKTAKIILASYLNPV